MLSFYIMQIFFKILVRHLPFAGLISSISNTVSCFDFYKIYLFLAQLCKFSCVNTAVYTLISLFYKGLLFSLLIIL